MSVIFCAVSIPRNVIVPVSRSTRPRHYLRLGLLSVTLLSLSAFRDARQCVGLITSDVINDASELSRSSRCRPSQSTRFPWDFDRTRNAHTARPFPRRHQIQPEPLFCPLHVGIRDWPSVVVEPFWQIPRTQPSFRCTRHRAVLTRCANGRPCSRAIPL